jgi:hypothetical protein
MTRLRITKEIEDEIDALYLVQPDVADAAEVLLRNLYENLDLLGHLHEPSTYPLHTPAFEVKLFVEAQQSGYNIYSLKFKDLNGFLADHRMFLGFDAQHDIYYALALTHRSIAYDTNHDAYRQMLARYEQRAIPKIS